MVKNANITERTTETLGPYRLLGVLAQGGMGRLYLASRHYSDGLSRVVTLKRILPEFAQTPRFRDMFLNEGRVAARLDHPNIVATHELGDADGEYFISMEYLPGEDLSAVLKRCRQASIRVPIDVAVSIATSCADALAFAHTLLGADGRAIGLVHRDVNPSNIILTYDGGIKLLDFGIAKVRDQTIQTQSGTFKGKLRYAAPEQLSGGVVDGRTDVFSLGIVLWECLTGTRLFHASTEALTFDAVSNHEIPPPSSMRADVSPALDAVVLKALDRVRSARFSSARAFADALIATGVSNKSADPQRRVSSWLESIFGFRRAALKLNIARGEQVHSSLSDLSADEENSRSLSISTWEADSSVRPKRGWSTDLPTSTQGEPLSGELAMPARLQLETTDNFVGASHFSTQSLQLAPTRRPLFLWMGVATILAAVLAGSIAVSESSRPSPAPVLGSTAQLTIESKPSGAQIFLDGEPTGLVTPAEIASLAPGREVIVRLSKSGFGSLERKLSVETGAMRREVFELNRTQGRLEIENVPSGASVFIDGQKVDPSAAIDLEVGKHSVRVEANGALLFERTVDVGPENQSINVGRGELGE